MAWKLTIEEINQYKEAFTLFDKDSDGKISSEDLGVLIRSLGQNFSNKDLYRITVENDKDDSGTIELHEFLNLMAENRKVTEDQSNLIKAIKYFDRDNTGLIDLEEFKHVLTCVSEKLNKEETDYLVQICKVDSNGKFNYNELLKLMLIK